MELAESIVNPDNPLTSRVMVNRIWYHLFGRGIVETVDNFGLQGKLPTHPGLLDFLAIKFQKDGWSTKKMIRYILMSDAFKRSVTAPGEVDKIDPENLLLSHFPRQRLEAEEIRDGLLAVSGRLDTTMYGKPVPVHITDFMQGRGKPAKSGPLDGKRPEKRLPGSKKKFSRANDAYFRPADSFYRVWKKKCYQRAGTITHPYE
ncbi:MAG: DUF1553 domain-containing protein [Bacteroidota bacterium]